jgi:hypothetical protein
MATLYPFPNPRFQAFSPATNLPLAGGLLYTYQAGTSFSVLQSLFSDPSGNTPLSNPCTLDSNGSIVAYGSGVYDIVVKDVNNVTQFTMDSVSFSPAASTGSSASMWVLQSGPFTYASSTAFTVPNDVTGSFTPGRAIRINIGTSLVPVYAYSYVLSSSYSGGTQKTTITMPRTIFGSVINPPDVALDILQDPQAIRFLAPTGSNPGKTIATDTSGNLNFLANDNSTTILQITNAGRLASVGAVNLAGSHLQIFESDGTTNLLDINGTTLTAPVNTLSLTGATSLTLNMGGTNIFRFMNTNHLQTNGGGINFTDLSDAAFFTINSSGQVTKGNAIYPVYNTSGSIVNTGMKIVVGEFTAGAGFTGIINLSGSAIFTNTSTFWLLYSEPSVPSFSFVKTSGSRLDWDNSSGNDLLVDFMCIGY